jgi:hypothetical protein
VVYFKDLSPYAFLPDDAGSLTVGWLEAAHEFSTGPAPPGFVDRLASLAVRHVVNRTRGWKGCPFCNESYPVEIDLEGIRYPIGDAEIRVAGRCGVVYAAPTLIVHYVAAHGYQPPADFVNGVMADNRR